MGVAVGRQARSDAVIVIDPTSPTGGNPVEQRLGQPSKRRDLVYAGQRPPARMTPGDGRNPR
jgi:hypothetical protein